MLALWLMGCSGPLEGVFVGDIPTVPGVLVAMSTGGSQVGVVVAGEGDTLSWSRYFVGPLSEEGTFSLSSDGWSVTGEEVAGGGFELTLTLPDGDSDPPFTLAPPVDPTSFDGPFTGQGGGCVPSAVVFNSGGQVQGGACREDGTPVPIVEKEPGLQLSANGTIEVEADLGSGPETLVLSQVAFSAEE